jgi:hypothetical protein
MSNPEADRILAEATGNGIEGTHAPLRDVVRALDAELRTFDITPRLSVRVLEGDLRGDIRRYLDIVASTRQRDLRR